MPADTQPATPAPAVPAKTPVHYTLDKNQVVANGRRFNIILLDEQGRKSDILNDAQLAKRIVSLLNRVEIKEEDLSKTTISEKGLKVDNKDIAYKEPVKVREKIKKIAQLLSKIPSKPSVKPAEPSHNIGFAPESSKTSFPPFKNPNGYGCYFTSGLQLIFTSQAYFKAQLQKALSTRLKDEGNESYKERMEFLEQFEILLESLEKGDMAATQQKMQDLYEFVTAKSSHDEFKDRLADQKDQRAFLEYTLRALDHGTHNQATRSIFDVVKKGPITKEPILMCAVPKTAKDVQDIINYEYAEREERDDWNVDDVYGKVDRYNVVQKFAQEPPEVLFIQLKRFDKKGSKSSQKIELTPVIDIAAATDSQTPVKYELQAVSLHSGTLKSGHYTAKVKDSQTKEWYEMNDLGNPLSKKLGADPAFTSEENENAYMLVYKKIV